MQNSIIKEFGIWLNNNTNLAESSKRVYLSEIEKFLREHRVVTEGNLRRFLLERKSDRVVYYKKFAIKHFLTFLNRQDLISALNPTFKMIKLEDRRHDRKIPNFGKFVEFLDNLSEDLRIMLMVMYDTGCRVGALLKLKVNDFRRDEKGYYLTLHEKRKKTQNRYLEEYTGKQLEGLINSKNLGSKDFIFKKKEESRYKAYYRYWTELKNKSRKDEVVSGDFGISFHWLRTTRAIELYDKWKDLIKVKSFLGHKAISTTMRYIDEGEVESGELVKEEKKWTTG